MSAVKAHEVRRFCDSLPSEGIFLVYGPDSGLVSETGRVVSRKLAGSGGADNLVTLESSEVENDLGRIAVEARTPSLFGDRRVIRLRGLPRNLAPVLSSLADDLAGASVIVEAGDLKKNDPVRAFVESSRVAFALPCYPDDDRAIQELVTTTLRDAGILADASALAAIRDHLGNDREVTRRELEKLVLYAGTGGRLTRDDVIALLGDNGGLTLDQIIDAVALGKAAEFEAAYGYARANGAQEQQILAMTLNHFRNLRRWRAEVDAGRSADQLLMGVHFSRKSAVGAQLRLWRDREIQQALDRLMAGILESRAAYDLRDTIAARALLAICLMAAER